jgi:phosphatidylserine decarboxylase
MLVSRFAGMTWAVQVFGLWIVGGAFAAGAYALHQPLAAWGALVPFALGLFVLSFYRDPERALPADPELWVSPADGVVTDIVEVDEPHYLKGRALRVGIFLSPLNVHVNRVSAAGVVEAVVPRAGLCLAATTPKCIDQNESVLLGIKSDHGTRYGLRQVTGMLARTIVCPARAGERYERGARYGMIKLGSRTELLLPVEAGFEPAVKIGDVVHGASTVIGRLAPARATKVGVHADRTEGGAA